MFGLGFLEIPEEKPKANNRNNPALNGEGTGSRQRQADSGWLGLLKGNTQPTELKESFIKPLTTI